MKEAAAGCVAGVIKTREVNALSETSEASAGKPFVPLGKPAQAVPSPRDGDSETVPSPPACAGEAARMEAVVWRPIAEGDCTPAYAGIAGCADGAAQTVASLRDATLE